MEDEAKALTVIYEDVPAQVESLPSLVAALKPAIFVWDEFFSGSIRNPHTRAAYSRSVRQFLRWAAEHADSLTQITPGLVGRYFDSPPRRSIPTKKLQLAALRAFFDALVNRHVILINPASTVRGERYQAIEGKTPEMSREQARTLLASINGLGRSIYAIAPFLRPKFIPPRERAQLPVCSLGIFTGTERNTPFVFLRKAARSV